MENSKRASVYFAAHSHKALRLRAAASDRWPSRFPDTIERYRVRQGQYRIVYDSDDSLEKSPSLRWDTEKMSTDR